MNERTVNIDSNAEITSLLASAVLSQADRLVTQWTEARYADLVRLLTTYNTMVGSDALTIDNLIGAAENAQAARSSHVDANGKQLYCFSVEPSWGRKGW